MAQGTRGSARRADRMSSFSRQAVSATTVRNAGVPGQDHHHGVKVDGAVGDSLQHKLLICKRTNRPFGKSEESDPSSLGLLWRSPIIFLPCLISISSMTAPNCSMALTVCKQSQSGHQANNWERQQDRLDFGRRTRSALWDSSGCTLPCSVRPVLKPAFLHSGKRLLLPGKPEGGHSTGTRVCDATSWLSWRVLLRVSRHYRGDFSGLSANCSTGSQHSGGK